MRFMLVKLVFLLCFLFHAAPGHADVFHSESFTLDNGLRVIVIPNHRAPVLIHMIWYQFGGADEKPGESGVAHFFEHLMFKGTPTVPDGSFSRSIRNMGGVDNAFTSRDYTAYYQKIPKAHLARVMEMEADRMVNLTLAQEQVLSERDVIIEERRQRVDNRPQALFQEQMNAALFINHPYGTPVIGWLHEIQDLTREQTLHYYDKWYKPNNAVVVIAGDVSAKEVKPLAEKYYGPLKPSKVTRTARPMAAPLLAEKRLSMSDPRVGIPTLIKKWRAPAGDDAIDVLAEILGGSSTSRLYKSLVVDQKLAVSVNMSYTPISMDDTALTISASPTPGTKMETLEAALMKDIDKVVKEGVTAEELKSAQSRKISTFTLYLDSLEGPAMLYGHVISSGRDTDYIESWPQRIQALTVHDIHEAMKMVFAGSDQHVTGTLYPEDEK